MKSAKAISYLAQEFAVDAFGEQGLARYSHDLVLCTNNGLESNLNGESSERGRVTINTRSVQEEDFYPRIGSMIVNSEYIMIFDRENSHLSPVFNEHPYKFVDEFFDGIDAEVTITAETRLYIMDLFVWNSLREFSNGQVGRLDYDDVSGFFEPAHSMIIGPAIKGRETRYTVQIKDGAVFIRFVKPN